MKSIGTSNDQWLHLKIFQVLLIELHFHHHVDRVLEKSKNLQAIAKSPAIRKENSLCVCVCLTCVLVNGFFGSDARWMFITA